MFDEDFLKQEVTLTMQDVLIGHQLLEKAMAHQPVVPSELDVLKMWNDRLNEAWKSRTGETLMETILRIAKETAEKEGETVSETKDK